jgi:hypothetical protein
MRKIITKARKYKITKNNMKPDVTLAEIQNIPDPEFDGFVKSPIAGHCEERSDEAIP